MYVIITVWEEDPVSTFRAKVGMQSRHGAWADRNKNWPIRAKNREEKMESYLGQ
jgi:hypothetical protein